MRYQDLSPAWSGPLPRRARRARQSASLGRCLCGCHQPTSARFAPGHDSILRSHTLAVELGEVRHAPAPHTLPVEIEIALRRERGLTGSTHDELCITADLVAALAAGEVA